MHNAVSRYTSNTTKTGLSTEHTELLDYPIVRLSSHRLQHRRYLIQDERVLFSEPWCVKKLPLHFMLIGIHPLSCSQDSEAPTFMTSFDLLTKAHRSQDHSIAQTPRTVMHILNTIPFHDHT